MICTERSVAPDAHPMKTRVRLARAKTVDVRAWNSGG